MKNILVPVGSSENATSHLQYAVDFAEAFNAKLVVVQVYNVFTKAGTLIKVEELIEKESREFLKQHISAVDAKGVEIASGVFKGELSSTLEVLCKKFEIDLIILEPKTNSVKEEVYLGKTSGKIIKQTNIPALIVPEGAVFKPFNKILMAIKSAFIKNESTLVPLEKIKAKFDASVNLLLVKTPYYQEGDFDVIPQLANMVSDTEHTEKPSTYHGVLEYFRENNPDLLVVIRRKRGFFAKLWEKNTVLKKDFYIASSPVLILRGRH